MYKPPGFATKHIFNPLVAVMTGAGISLRGSRILSVAGRKSGKTYSTPVNPLDFEGRRYLVAPRGETGWVRNIRVSGRGELRVGRTRESIAARELGDAEKLPVLRAYLRNWKMETSAFFDGLTDESPDDELQRIAPSHPVFEITSA